jgi:hypothetical protein
VGGLAVFGPTFWNVTFCHRHRGMRNGEREEDFLRIENFCTSPFYSETVEIKLQKIHV